MNSPTYELALVKLLLDRQEYVITHAALAGALALGLDAEVIVVVCHGLAANAFYKTMPAKKLAGFMQDVYKVRHESLPLYVKLQIGPTGRLVIISFKLDESPW